MLSVSTCPKVITLSGFHYTTLFFITNIRYVYFRYHYFLQLKMDVVDGRLRCNYEQAIVLASYSLQVNISFQLSIFPFFNFSIFQFFNFSIFQFFNFFNFSIFQFFNFQWHLFKQSSTCVIKLLQLKYWRQETTHLYYTSCCTQRCLGFLVF